MIYIYMYNIYSMAHEIGFNLMSSHTKDSKKWYLIPPCLTQYYKVCIKSKMEKIREKSSTLPYTSV